MALAFTKVSKSNYRKFTIELYFRNKSKEFDFKRETNIK